MNDCKWRYSSSHRKGYEYLNNKCSLSNCICEENKKTNLNQIKMRNVLTPRIRQEKEVENFIYTDEITDEHLVVAITKSKEPLILSKGWSEENQKLSFFVFTSKFIRGNAYGFLSSERTYKLMTEEAIRQGFKVKIFHQNNYKEALQWLIDNGK